MVSVVQLYRWGGNEKVKGGGFQATDACLSKVALTNRFDNLGDGLDVAASAVERLAKVLVGQALRILGYNVYTSVRR